VNETLRMAMPETMLGLFPDVGAIWFLSRCPGAIGRYLALIGPQLGAADAVAVGLATHHVATASFDLLVADLAAAAALDRSAVDAAIGRYATAATGGALAGRRAVIDRLFGSDDLDAVVAAIDRAEPDADWIAAAQAALRHASPTSLRATWRRMVEGRGQSIERILTDDYRMAVRIVGGPDFPEGVRAILVDKDRSPRWKPASLAEVTAADIDALLQPLPAAEELRLQPSR
jgi:enoyl-CoA hydratase